jgi:hypothetical protein
MWRRVFVYFPLFRQFLQLHGQQHTEENEDKTSRIFDTSRPTNIRSQRHCRTPTATPPIERTISPNSNLFVSLQVHRQQSVLSSCRTAQRSFRLYSGATWMSSLLSPQLETVDKVRKGVTSVMYRIQRYVVVMCAWSCVCSAVVTVGNRCSLLTFTANLLSVTINNSPPLYSDAFF